MYHRFLSLASILILVAFPTWFAFAQQSPEARASLSDRDKAGLRGRVNTVVDETTTRTYTPDGRILEERTKNFGSEWVTSYTYYSDGHLFKTASGNAGSTNISEIAYLYDEARRLVGLKAGDKVQINYQHDDKGRKSVIESFDSPPRGFVNPAYIPWENTDLGFTPSPGGTVTKLYNEQGVATGAQLRDAEAPGPHCAEVRFGMSCDRRGASRGCSCGKPSRRPAVEAKSRTTEDFQHNYRRGSQQSYLLRLRRTRTRNGTAPKHRARD